MDLKQFIKHKAAELGFDLAGFTSAEALDNIHTEHFRQYIKSKRNADMDWLSRNIEKRFNPTLLLPGASSVICLAVSYKIDYANIQFPRPNCKSSASVSDYALYDDYHRTIKTQMSLLIDLIKAETTEPFEYKLCVDSAPVLERALAQRAGLGFIGKNTMLINPQLGPEIFLAEIITTLNIPPDKPYLNTCMGCDKCISACPVGALEPVKGLDARKCISYHTIENKGIIEPNIADKISDSIFGCDRCVVVCPYAENAEISRDNFLTLRPERKYHDPEQIMKWDNRQFNAMFKTSPAKRLGLERLKRNAAELLRKYRSNEIKQ